MAFSCAHCQRCSLSIDLKNDQWQEQEITLEIKQQPHQYLEEELRDLIFKLYPNNEYIKDDIKVMVDKIFSQYCQIF